MLVIPAIDLKGGRVVRLLRGDFSKETVYSEDPVAVAKEWAAAGAQRLHLVDLDGALEGTPRHLGEIERIAREVKVPVEVGGGIRSLETIREYVDAGVAHVILGTKACSDEGFVDGALRGFPGKVIAAVDETSAGHTADDKVLISVGTGGWVNQEVFRREELLERLVKQGLTTVIYTVVAQDGTMQGPAVESYRQILSKFGGRITLIASGGVSSLEDLLRLKRLEPEGLTGAIVGRALYEKKLNLAEAIERCARGA